MNRLGQQSGFTLIELLVSCTLMIIVLSATLGALDVFGKTTATNQQVSDAQDTARNTLDRMSWELRNATAYQVVAGTTPSAVSRAFPWDIVFKTVDPNSTPSGTTNPNNVMRVRYCLDTTSQTLYRQIQTWSGSGTAPSTPTDLSCPAVSAGWTGSPRVAATNVVNTGARRVFTYNQQDESDVNAAAVTPSDIAAVRVRLYIDPNPGKAPAETALATGVFVRNQNQRPVASCTASPSANGHVFLNASASVDPEGGILTYAWTDGGTPITAQTAANFDYTPPATGSHSFAVTVKDDSNLSSASTACTPDPVIVR